MSPFAGGLEVPVPTQTVHPWRASLRTTIEAIIGLAALFPAIVAAIGHVPPWLAPILAGAAAVAGAVTRIATIPGVNAWLTRLGAGAAPKPAPALPPEVTPGTASKLN